MIRNNLRYIIASVAIAVVSACGCAKQRTLPQHIENKDIVRYAGDLSFSSAILGMNVNFSILLPKDYVSKPEKRYPVVYMCHGLGDNNNSWNDKWLRIEEKVTELEARGLDDMIYVFPNGLKTYYVNRVDGTFRYMDMFIREFIPHIDRTYRTIADKRHRSVTGYSMGGFGALALAEKNPDMFLCCAPLSMSFRTDQQYMTEAQEVWDNQWGWIFGGKGSSGEARLTDYYKSFCPFYQFVPENRSILSKVNWFLTCGDDEEQLLIANDELHVQMRDNGYEHEYRVKNGGHTGSYWRSALDEVLPYFASHMGGSSSWTYTDIAIDIPDCVIENDGSFVSAAYWEKEGKSAIYMFHEGIGRKLLDKSIAIMQRGVSARPYVILPCDLGKASLESWLAEWEKKYTAEKKVAIAFGKAGKEVWSKREHFGKLLFEDAYVSDNICNEKTDKGIFYYMGLPDDGLYYKDMGGLYKLCKAQGAKFEYRVRNSAEDTEKSFLQGIESMKEFIFY